jgi:sugar (pentulose or hexulose) kinase
MDKAALRQLAADMVGLEISEPESQALAGVLASAAKAIAALPGDALKNLEPPLRLAPGPRASGGTR